MDEGRQLTRRLGGHVVLAAVAALLFLSLRAAAVRGSFDLDAVEVANRPEDVASFASGFEEPRPSELQAVQDTTARLEGVPVLVDNSLAPVLDPFTFEGQKPEHKLLTYTVQANDTPIGIAEKFDIEPETLLGGNPFLSEESNALRTGTELIIMPVDGVLHEVVAGDTLESLSERYGIPTEDIVGYEANRLEFPYRLYPGTKVIIPGAVREVFVWSAPSLPTRPRSSDSTGTGIAPQIQGTGTFIWPISGRRITQHYWYGHQAIDVGVPEGGPVVASDTGTVTWAGWNVYGYGNLIVVNHGNGYETYYAHLSGIGVVPGQIVYQGNYIGATGNTGRSSGPHLHFEIRYFNALLEPLGWLR